MVYIRLISELVFDGECISILITLTEKGAYRVFERGIIGHLIVLKHVLNC